MTTTTTATISSRPFHAFIYIPSRLSTGEVVGREQVWASFSDEKEALEAEAQATLLQYPDGVLEYWQEKPSSPLPSAGEKIAAAVSAAEFSKPSIRRVLESFLGTPAIEGENFGYGDLPRDKIQTVVEDHRIITIRWWSGLKWSARGGYGLPSVEVTLR